MEIQLNTLNSADIIIRDLVSNSKPTDLLINLDEMLIGWMMHLDNISSEEKEKKYHIYLIIKNCIEESIKYIHKDQTE